MKTNNRNKFLNETYNGKELLKNYSLDEYFYRSLCWVETIFLNTINLLY